MTFDKEWGLDTITLRHAETHLLFGVCLLFPDRAAVRHERRMWRAGSKIIEGLLRDLEGTDDGREGRES